MTLCKWRRCVKAHIDVNTSRTPEEGAHNPSWPNGFIFIVIIEGLINMEQSKHHTYLFSLNVDSLSQRMLVCKYFEFRQRCCNSWYALCILDIGQSRQANHLWVVSIVFAFVSPKPVGVGRGGRRTGLTIPWPPPLPPIKTLLLWVVGCEKSYRPPSLPAT